MSSSLPELIEAKDVSTGTDEPHGIIYLLSNNVSNIISYVIPTTNAGTSYGNINGPITRNNWFQSGDRNDAYYQIEFKDRYVYPTHYSFKGYNGPYSFTKEWYVQGLNSLSDSPTLLTTETNEGSSFCSNEINCDNSNWATFAIPKQQKAFRFIRFTRKTSSTSSKSKRVLFAGIDVFGIYSKDGKTNFGKAKRTYCFKSYPLYRRETIYPISKIIFVCMYKT